ncbi:recombinase family protein [Rufibacter immobilis]|uniref:Recombinase family protein n=1 Tax=Rufibacter immobilis TaxID=1348778 RepID=A0A3M9MZF0_9BACT|nr:recombinase family protein [Rufibacter immobilis]RNI30931.1 recombinase family protein [Rufibacter immobilis]
MKVIEFYRVSTQRQGQSGLGQQGQERDVREYIRSTGATSIATFIEVESGGNKDRISADKAPVLSQLLAKRPKLHEAIKLSIETGAVILVKELSRLTRFSLLMNYIAASGARFVCVNSPNDDMTILRIKCALHEDELLKVSQRTKAALKSKKLQGFNLGTPQNLTNEHRLKGSQSRQKQVQESIISRQSIDKILDLRLKEKMTLKQIADKLNHLGYKTPRGLEFKTGTVDMYLRRHQKDSESVTV